MTVFLELIGYIYYIFIKEYYLLLCLINFKIKKITIINV